jgi:hypothetical protein
MTAKPGFHFFLYNCIKNDVGWNVKTLEQLDEVFHIRVVKFVVIYSFNLDGIRELVFIWKKLHFSAGFCKKVVVIVCMVYRHMRPEGVFDTNVKIPNNNEN